MRYSQRSNVHIWVIFLGMETKRLRSGNTSNVATVRIASREFDNDDTGVKITVPPVNSTDKFNLLILCNADSGKSTT